MIGLHKELFAVLLTGTTLAFSGNTASAMDQKNENQIEFKKDFPQFSNNIIIVVDAKKSDVAEDIATYLYNEIKKEDKILFNDIFYPEELSFFKKNGYLYLTEDELDKTLEQIISYQPFIFKLSQEPTLNGLLSTINLFLSAELSQDNLENVNNFLKKFVSSSTCSKISTQITKSLFL